MLGVAEGEIASIPDITPNGKYREIYTGGGYRGYIIVA
jgi:hypothetical protein